ncbi:MAG: ParA family protein [Prevotella sp.]|nr:ParA family protein [Prevotella sp.]
MNARKITVVNHKGGVGKTMTTASLGAALAVLGKKVLLVDSDSQCNLTSQCIEDVKVPTLHEYLNDDDIHIQPQEVSENLFIIPGSSQLDEDNNNIVLSVEDDADAATHYIDSILKRVEDDYDYILVDSAPGSGAMLVNVIVAADELLVPIADRFSISGAKKLTQIIRANKKSIKGHYLLTRQTNYGLHRQIKELLTAQSPESLYHTSIRQCEDLNKASAYRMSIFDYKPKSKGAEDYMALAKEISGVSKETDMPF